MRETWVSAGLRFMILPVNQLPHVSWDVVTEGTRSYKQQQQLFTATVRYFSFAFPATRSATPLPWREPTHARTRLEQLPSSAGLTSASLANGSNSMECLSTNIETSPKRRRPSRRRGKSGCGCTAAKFKQVAHSLLFKSTWSSAAS